MARLIKPVSEAVASEPWRYLHEIADSANPRIVKAFLDAVFSVKNGFNRRRYVSILERYDFERALNELNWEYIANTEMLPEVAATLRDVLESAAQFLPLPVNADIAWDILDPRAVAWVREESGTLITNITQQTRQAVRETIQRGFEKGQSVQQMAETIRDTVGMNTRQAGAYARYKEDLMARGLPESRVKTLADAYERKLIKQRATLIARTESIKAANEGWRQGIDKAAEDNLLDPNVWEIAWIVTQDDRKCEKCQSMRGKRRPINGVYAEGEYKGTKGPPAHPGCRCAERTARKSERMKKAA
jgi:hypothetical protein